MLADDQCVTVVHHTSDCMEELADRSNLFATLANVMNINHIKLAFKCGHQTHCTRTRRLAVFEF